MKTAMIGLVLCACAASAWGKVFQMDRKGDATVEIVESGDEYKVTCMFSPQTKFRDAVNAKFNDNKGDAICKKGIARYLNASSKDVISISGQYSAAPVKTVDGKLCYSFGIPISGCKVTSAKTQPNAHIEPAMSVAVSSEAAKAVRPEEAGEERAAEKKVNLKEKSYVCVTSYKEVDGRKTMVAQREYRACSFKSRQEFDRFCQDEFARIRALGEANLQSVRNFGK